MEPIEEQVFWAVYAASPRWQKVLGMDICLQLKTLYSTDDLFRVLVQRENDEYGKPLVFAWPRSWLSWPIEEIPRLVADLEAERDEAALLEKQRQGLLLQFEAASAKMRFLQELKTWLVSKTSTPALFEAAEADLKQAQEECHYCMQRHDALGLEIRGKHNYITECYTPRVANPLLDVAVVDLEGLWQGRG